MLIENYDVINVGSEELIFTADLVRLICDEIGYNGKAELIEFIDLPDRMTLEKIPDVKKMSAYSCHTPKISIREGVKLVINELRNDALKF